MEEVFIIIFQEILSSIFAFPPLAIRWMFIKNKKTKYTNFKEYYIKKRKGIGFISIIITLIVIFICLILFG